MKASQASTADLKAEIVNLRSEVSELKTALKELESALKAKQAVSTDERKSDAQSWSTVVARKRRPKTNRKPPPRSSDSTSAATLSSSSGQASKLRPKVTVMGSRKIWGTLRSTTVAAIRNAFKATKVQTENLTIRRKYSMARGTSLEQKWWFVIKGDEEVLVQLQEEWDQSIGVQTTWKLEPLLQYAQTQVSNTVDNALNSLPNPITTSTNMSESSNFTAQSHEGNDTSAIGDSLPHPSPNNATPPTTSND